ncbi:MaoC family dehydratase N-terminal domain-containing protein [Nocardia sp. NPDC059764]|uniref:MaoC family dehydratase N-terminal domain-containing protein n=1 Tax=Nocardia sp. NPDC059764 TaxID=3346939 RepID=UPI00364914CA
MPIDTAAALELPLDPVTVYVERGRLRLFAKAIGETDPLYTDVAAARQAGHPDLPVPPTFFFSLELEAPDPFAYLTALGVDLRRVLHGEQSFTYHRPAHAGDTLTLQPRIVDVYSKKGGALEFLVKQTGISRGEELVAEASSVIVVRNPEMAK